MKKTLAFASLLLCLLLCEHGVLAGDKGDMVVTPESQNKKRKRTTSITPRKKQKVQNQEDVSIGGGESIDPSSDTTPTNKGELLKILVKLTDQANSLRTDLKNLTSNVAGCEWPDPESDEETEMSLSSEQMNENDDLPSDTKIKGVSADLADVFEVKLNACPSVDSLKLAKENGVQTLKITATENEKSFKYLSTFKTEIKKFENLIFVGEFKFWKDIFDSVQDAKAICIEGPLVKSFFTNKVWENLEKLTLSNMTFKNDVQIRELWDSLNKFNAEKLKTLSLGFEDHTPNNNQKYMLSQQHKVVLSSLKKRSPGITSIKLNGEDITEALITFDNVKQ